MVIGRAGSNWQMSPPCRLLSFSLCSPKHRTANSSNSSNPVPCVLLYNPLFAYCSPPNTWLEHSTSPTRYPRARKTQKHWRSTRRPLTTNDSTPTFENEDTSKEVMQHQYLSHPLGPLSQQGQAMNHSTGPNSGGGGEVPWGAPFPSLHLWPIQDTFQMKMIHLPEGQRVSIGPLTTSLFAVIFGRCDGKN